MIMTDSMIRILSGTIMVPFSRRAAKLDTFFLHGIHGTRGVMRDSDGTITVTIAPRRGG